MCLKQHAINQLKNMSEQDIIEGYKIVQNKIQEAYTRRNKDLPDIKPRLVAVSKTKPVEHIIALYQIGHRHFGENYIQELNEKAFNEEIQKVCTDIKWHYIGHLQRNKVPKLLNTPHLYLVETVDSEKLATALDNGVGKKGSNDKLNVFVQVNTSQEPEKNGVAPDRVVELVKHVLSDCPHLNFSGLMTIGKFGYSLSEGPNPDFQCLVKCREDVCRALDVPIEQVELSMGMSDDFEHAVEVGSTNVRVGSLIFGYRPKKGKLSHLNPSEGATAVIEQKLNDTAITDS